jgi:hypothetical protein
MTVFYALQKLRASTLEQLVGKLVRKGTDESVNSGSSGTTLQDDNELFETVVANTTYAVTVTVLAIEAGGIGVTDLKIAWTMPTGCTLDLAVTAPHIDWNAAAGAVEIEWAGWQNETSSPTSSKNFGTTNSASFSYKFDGSLQVGSTGGTFRMQWAQRVANPANLTVRAGSRMWLQPIPS